jgi:hypothetical protein
VRGRPLQPSLAPPSGGGRGSTRPTNALLEEGSQRLVINSKCSLESEHTRSRMSQGDELWAQVVKLQHKRPHTILQKISSADAKTTVQDFEPRTAEVGKEIISIVWHSRHAAVIGMVPIPTDG